MSLFKAFNCKLFLFTFSSEKVLHLCKLCPPPLFFSNVHVLRPTEHEKIVFITPQSKIRLPMPVKRVENRVVTCRLIEVIFILILLKWFFGFFFPFGGLHPRTPSRSSAIRPRRAFARNPL